VSEPRTLAPSHPGPFVPFDLDAYLARIGWSDALEPSLATLTRLTRAHIARIPFENVDVLLGRGIRIDLDSIVRKIVVDGRGGYCFEHGTLFQAALERIGFRVTAHAARVLMFLPRHLAPRTHMFLIVHIDGARFVVDPGFGGHSAAVPVSLEGDTRDGFDRHRIVERDGEWILEADIDGTMTPLWTSTLESQYTVDFELANHWIATSPGSPFVNRLMLRALRPEGRTSVMNRDVTVVRDGKTEKYQLADRKALRTLLTGHFGFDLPDVERLRVPAVPEWS
jgi:N-hydroxyarylamine O-acetyltransferase